MHCSFLKNECRFIICWYYLIIIIVNNNNFYSQQLLSFLYFLHFKSVHHHEHDVCFLIKFLLPIKKKIAIISYTSNTRLNSFYDPFYLSNMLGLCYLYTTLYSTDQNLLCILFYFPYKITEILKQKKKIQTHGISQLVEVEHKKWHKGFVLVIQLFSLVYIWLNRLDVANDCVHEFQQFA